MAKIDLIGKKFGRLLVIACGENKYKGRASYICRCDCGNTKEIVGYSLVDGRTKSCGCLHDERVKIINITHGMKRTRQYRIWSGMKGRCNLSTNSKYYMYGKRGIKICDRWLKFENFWADMKDGYRDNLTIDRIDNNGNYELGNCRWSTPIEQANNTRRNKLITYNNRTQNLTQWAKELNINYFTLSSRLTLYGWSINRALTTPCLNA